MEKIKLKSMGKGSLRNEFVFGKSWKVIDKIGNIFERLGIPFSFPNGLRDIMGCEALESNADINQWRDDIYNLRGGGYSADIFIGEKVIMLVINSCENKQKEVSEAVFEFADFEGGVNGKC